MRDHDCEYYLGLIMGLCLDLMKASYLDLLMDFYLVHFMEQSYDQLVNLLMQPLMETSKVLKLEYQFGQ